MARTQIVYSDAEDGDSNPSPRRSRKATAKKQEQQDSQIEKMQKKMARIEKENARLKRQQKLKAPTAKDADKDYEGDEDPEIEKEYESEEQDGPDLNPFDSAFQSVGIINEPTPEAPRRLLRKEGDGPLTGQHSRNSADETAGMPRTAGGSHARPSQQDGTDAAPSGSDSRCTPQASAIASSNAVQLHKTSTSGRQKRLRERSHSTSHPHQAVPTNGDESDEPVRKQPRIRNEHVSGRAASDYDPHVKKLILKAVRDFESRVLAEDPFPASEVQARWASEAWEIAQANVDDAQRYALPDRISHLITSRTSRPRGALRDKVRPSVAASFGFSLDGDNDAKKKNYTQYQSLMNFDEETMQADPVFHFKDVGERAGYAQNPIIFQAIRDAWFPSNGHKVGIQFASRFDPISIQSLALIFTTIHFCLDQWADGSYNDKLELTEAGYKTEYEKYVARLSDWANLNRAATLKIRKKLSSRARRATGVPAAAPATGLPADVRERARAELEDVSGDTGEDDN